MSKRVSWNLYSKRRQITIQSLTDLGKITDYASYVAYCDKFEVQPISELAFNSEERVVKQHTQPSSDRSDAEISTASISADAPVESELPVEPASEAPMMPVETPLTSSVPDAPTHSNISDEPQTLPLIATVWLAGVSDDTKTSSNMSSLLPQKQEDVRYKSKKKKNKGTF